MEQNQFISIDVKTGIAKGESFCAYQERSQYEVRGKLIKLGLRGEELEEVISHLITNNFLNEERFAKAYAQGKLRIKSWGKNKISQGLKFKQVSAPLIKKALQSLDGDEYLEKLKMLIIKKEKDIKEKVDYKKKYKLVQYALSRGFEQDLIFFVLKDNDL
ncbi:MAG: RecX family transcriptional regulator [Bacteroidetes bacterium]|nr:RecX family transcriptional regulator [Bacteroidota bacterium]MBU1372109.1 RecX family transcriptional regulator [Bacteroidota bacterium]MBU1484030.1 RecX family transcriptional regulator [Bacteroidota bacterium]MBU1760446.1 RecX family transcriptional regulator [Bacteroidota bacterium]MBU2268787.1 RecX family transcriptional regulator [Bacteroidota bacterium]